MLQLTDDSLLWARSSSQGRIASHMEQALNEHWSYMGIRRCWNNHNYNIYHHSTNRNHRLKVFSPSVSFIHIYSTSHLSYVTTPMTQVETSCTVYLKGSTPKCSTLDSSTHGERHHKSGMWTMMNNPASNWARPQWMANYWAQKLSTKVHDIIKTHLSVVHILSPLFPFSWMKLWQGTSPADNFIGLFLPGCWSLTKVCPVEERSVMEISNGSTSDKLPPVVTSQLEVSVWHF